MFLAQIFYDVAIRKGLKNLSKEDGSGAGDGKIRGRRLGRNADEILSLLTNCLTVVIKNYF